MASPTSLRSIAACAAFALLHPCAPAAAQAPDAAKSADTMFVERAALRAANAACNLFEPGEALALDMGFYQARNALLRGGYDSRMVAALEREAADYAGDKSCDDPAMASSAALLKNAYKAFTRTPFMEFKGDVRQWTATRTLTDTWSAWQQAPGSPVRFGLIRPIRADDPLALGDPDAPREDPVLAAALPLRDGAGAPAYARIWMRDPRKLPEMWDGGLRGFIPGALDAPPRGLSRQIWASERRVVDGPPYGDGDKTPDALFLFDARAEKLLSELDPREAVTLEFTPSDRDRKGKPVRVVMEVGDFRAAAAFSRIPRNTAVPAPH